MFLTATWETAGVSIRGYTLAQRVVILVSSTGVRCSLEGNLALAERSYRQTSTRIRIANTMRKITAKMMAAIHSWLTSCGRRRRLLLL